MLRLSLALAAVALVAAPTIADAAKKPAPVAKPAPTVAAKAKQCRDAKGHFAPCGVTVVNAGPGPGDVTKDANGKCHWKAGKKKGQFVKCP